MAISCEAQSNKQNNQQLLICNWLLYPCFCPFSMFIHPSILLDSSFFTLFLSQTNDLPPVIFPTFL